MSKASKNVVGLVPSLRRRSVAAFAAFALLGGGVVCGVARADVASADQNQPSDTSNTGDESPLRLVE
ncbi:hypothetical protein QDX21_07840 [Auritidibacter ignavus]|uniref:Uncharacterized protein n=1 Tax=Auritidibacter ignavus TaxID=678932 RepID=A0AAJ6AFC5_9MICC|nr:hypothetical protein [Auritidibacter ignavus]WGH92241.1 hypothetical protein QDX21_07840 [Auritidibacter ignavus]WHS27087.1 hypothetical protein QM395_06625 [Auritidibacter ignavus]